MSRNLNIIIILLALLPIALYIIWQPQLNKVSQFDIIPQDKISLIDYSYHILDDYYMENETNINLTLLDKEEQNMNYNILFITLLTNGTVRGCQSGSTPRNDENRLSLDIQEAIRESIEDDRFGGPLQKEELSDTRIMFTFLYNISWLYNTSFTFLKNNIELGIHAIEIMVNNTPIIFKESVPISNNYDLEYLLERLCNKASLNKECYINDNIDMYRYDTLTFMGDRAENITDLYRYNILINMDDINNDMIYDRLLLAHDWFIHTIKHDDLLLEYLYYPSEDTYSLDNNHIRQLASLWSITELNSFLKNNKTNNLINTTLTYYLEFLNSTETFSYLTINNESKLANNAFLILSLLNTPGYPNQEYLLEQLANGILSLQYDNGSYHTYFFSERNTGIDYYPGEAMLSLMKLYHYNENESYLESVKKGFSYYRDYWRNNKNNAFITWHTQTYKLLYDQTQDAEIASFIFEMNDWVIDTYQMQSSKYPDEIGGFPLYYPTFTTSVFLEGINDAYTVAVAENDSFHMQKYKEAIRLGIRFVLQTQYTEENSFYLENETRAIGGFRTSLTENSIRIDNTQHGVMALMKTYGNNIFLD